MTSSVTTAELASRYSVVAAKPSAFDRNKFQDPDDLLNATKEMVFRTLNSDVDAVYYLMGLLADRIRVHATKVMEYVVTLQSDMYRAREPDSSGDNSLVVALHDVAEQMESADSTEYARLLVRFKGLLRELVESQRTSFGDSSIGKTPTEARMNSYELIKKVHTELSSLRTESSLYLNAPNDYMGADFESILRTRQAATTKNVLLSNLGREQTDLQRTTIDTALALSVLTNRSAAKFDVLTYKYEGIPVDVGGMAPSIEGGTVPFITPSSPVTAGFDITTTSGVEACTCSLIAAATPPTLLVTVDPSFIEYSETGLLIASAGINTQVLKSDGSGSADGDLPWLKTYVKAGSITIRGTVDDGGSPVSVVVTDDGLGVFSSTPPGYVSGSVDYATGELSLVVIGGSLHLYVGSVLQCAYSCYPIGNFVVRSGAVGGPSTVLGTFGSMSLFKDNTLVTASVSSTCVTSVAVLAARLHASDIHAVESIDVADDDQKIAFTGPSVGSAHRLLLPEVTPGTATVVNTTPFSPTFSTVGTLLNGFLGQQGTEAYGSDVYEDALVTAGSIEAVVTRSTLYDSAAVINGGDVTVTDGTGIQVGDDVAVSLPDNTVHTKVTSVAGGVVNVSPVVPLPLDSGFTLLPSISAQTQITRNSVMVRCTNQPPMTLTVSVGSSDLGFTLGDSDLGYSDTVSLQQSLSFLPSIDFYAVHTGDVVTSVASGAETLLGRVTATRNSTLTIAYEAGVTALHPWNVGNQWSPIRVYPAGYYGYRLVVQGVQSVFGSLERLLATDMVSLAEAYLFAGTKASEYASLLTEVGTYVSVAQAGVQGILFTKVLLVDELLSNLSSDRGSVVRDLLMLCKFKELSQLTTDKVSDVAAMEDLLVGLAYEYGKGADEVVQVSTSEAAPSYPGSR